MFSNFQSDLGRMQEPVYGHDGRVIGAVVFNPFKQCWEGCAEGPMHGPFRSRAEAENYVHRTASAQAQPSRPQAQPQGYAGPQPGTMDVGEVIGVLLTGAAIVGALSGFFSEEQPGHSQPSELEKQNDLLRQQNELLKQALGQRDPKSGPLTKR